MEDSDVYEITLNLDVYLKIHNENVLKKKEQDKDTEYVLLRDISYGMIIPEI